MLQFERQRLAEAVPRLGGRRTHDRRAGAIEVAHQRVARAERPRGVQQRAPHRASWTLLRRPVRRNGAVPPETRLSPRATTTSPGRTPPDVCRHDRSALPASIAAAGSLEPLRPGEEPLGRHSRRWQLRCAFQPAAVRRPLSAVDREEHDRDLPLEPLAVCSRDRDPGRHGVVIVAAYLPVCQAIRIEPVVALKHECPPGAERQWSFPLATAPGRAPAATTTAQPRRVVVHRSLRRVLPL